VPERRWPPERFAAVADHLSARGLRVVLTGGAEEHQIVSDVAQAMRSPSVNLVGRTSLGALAALLCDAELLVSNDTGVMHVGEAVRTPLVAVSFDPEGWRWAPQDAGRCCVLAGGTDVGLHDVLEAAIAQLCRRTSLRADGRSPAGQTPDGGSGRSGRG
jgi:ADP-heptose:LPS heptosyltransferase